MPASVGSTLSTESIVDSMIPAISPKAILPSTNASTATSFAADSTAGRAPPSASARYASRDAWEPFEIGWLEIVTELRLVGFRPERPQAVALALRRAVRKTLWVSQRVADRQSHIGRGELRFDAAVGEDDETVCNRLRMNDDAHAFCRNAEQPAGFDDFQPLVHHGGGVDRVLRTHAPRRMCERLRDAGVGHFFARRPPKRTARRGKHDRRDASATSSPIRH